MKPRNAKTGFLPLLLCLALAAPLAHAQDAPAWGLEAVLDSRSAHADGLPVLAVTPGGAAERMGVAPGDRILSINGRALANAASPARALDDALHASNGRAEVVLLRDGHRMTLQGTLAQALAKQAIRGCGYVSDIDPAPRVTAGVYEGEITQIDGRSTPLQGSRNRFELAAGQHVLVVRELFPSHLLTSGQLRQRRLMQQRELGKAYKAIVVEVKPDTRYSIGTRLLRDKLDNDSIRANAYWEPVVFTTRSESCR